MALDVMSRPKNTTALPLRRRQVWRDIHDTIGYAPAFDPAIRIVDILSDAPVDLHKATLRLLLRAADHTRQLRQLADLQPSIRLAGRIGVTPSALPPPRAS